MGEADRLESSARIKDKPILRFDHATVRGSFYLAPRCEAASGIDSISDTGNRA